MDDLKEKYRALKIWMRLIIMGCLGLLPAVYVYFDEGETLVLSLAEAETKVDEARANFEAARKKKENLPNLEEQLAFTEEQLAKARKKLPDNYFVEIILQKAATIAREVGVKLQLFDPGTEKVGEGDFRYMELPIVTEVDGPFARVAAFLDRMVHLENSIFIRNVDLQNQQKVVGGRQIRSSSSEQDTDLNEKARRARQNLEVKAVFDLVIYRAMSDAEIAQAAAAASPGAPGTAGAPGAPAAKPQAAVDTGKEKDISRL